ncbi:MAG: hypothetical protein AB8G15_18155 [Saprospiraceae bacterium]
MKTLNLRTILNSALTMLAFALIFTACSKDETTAPATAVDHNQLAKMVAADANFQSIQQINEEVVKAIENGSAVTDLEIVSEANLATLRTQLIKNIPALQQMEEAAISAVLVDAANLGQPVLERGPGCIPCRNEATAALSACSAAAYAVYLSGGTYQAYVNAYHTICVPQYYSTVANCPC